MDWRVSSPIRPDYVELNSISNALLKGTSELLISSTEKATEQMF